MVAGGENPPEGVRAFVVRSTSAGVGSSCTVTCATGAHRLRRPWQIQGGKKLNHERGESPCRKVHSGDGAELVRRLC